MRAKEKNRTGKNIRKKKRRKKRYLLRFFILAALCTGLYFGTHIDYFNVNGIGVVGNKEISDEEILKLSELEAGDNIFDIHPMLVQRKIKKNLYVADVDVDRKLPNKVEIIVTEQTGKAQFADEKRFIITDIEGKVLEISKEERKVTMVDNVKVESAQLKKTVKVRQQGVYDRAMAMIAATEEADIYFKRINISSGVVEAYVYDDLKCRGSYSAMMECIESGALKAVIFDLYQEGTEEGTINVGSNNYCSFTP